MELCQIVGKRFSMGEELSRLGDVRMTMCFIPYRKAFCTIWHSTALLEFALQRAKSLTHKLVLFQFAFKIIDVISLHTVRHINYVGSNLGIGNITFPCPELFPA